MNNPEKIIAIDFDNVIAKETDNKEIGEEIPGAIETIKKLIEEGWKIYIFSHRGMDEENKRIMEAWLYSRGLNLPIIAKPYARYYIDDRAIEFKNSWDKIYSIIHNDIQAEMPCLSIEKIYPIVDEYVQMLDTNNLEDTDNAAVFNRLKNEIGLDIDKEEVILLGKQSSFWDMKLNRLSSKINNNTFKEGDSVLILNGKYFGETGTVYTIKDNVAEVICDADNKFLKIENCFNNLKYFPYIFRKTYKDISDIKNSYYTEPLPIYKIAEYYKNNIENIFGYYDSVDSIGIFDLFGVPFAQKVAGVNDINFKRLRGLRTLIPNKRYYHPIGVGRGMGRGMGRGVNSPYCIFKNTVNDIVYQMNNLVEDIQISLDGDRGVIIYLLFNKPVDEQLIAEIKNYLEEIISNSKVNINLNPKTVPLLDSVDENTLLINKKVNLNDLEGEEFPVVKIE